MLLYRAFNSSESKIKQMEAKNLMRSITDEILGIPKPDPSEFQAYWQKWVHSDLAVAYRVFLSKYNIDDVLGLPYPEYDRNAEQDEQLAQVLEDCLLIREIRKDRDRFIERMEENNLSYTQIYQAFILEVVRLWWFINPDMKAIRRIWYKGFKVFGQYLRENEFSESDNGLLIKACGNWISKGLMFYSNFFVQDSSRKMFTTDSDRGWNNVFLVCEKDAATDELNALGDLIGAMFVISGHGVPSMAACEKSLVLRQLQYMKRNHPEEKRIILAIVSDYDHAGINGVAGGFVQQFKTFCDNLGLELVYKRVGLLPSHVPDHRLSPSFALYSPPVRGVIRCLECEETVYICNVCGKVKNVKKKPKICNKPNKDGDRCDGTEFTVVNVGTKVMARNSKTGFLRKDDRDLVKREPSQASNFINLDSCPSCGEINQELSLEANYWSKVSGVPYCITHQECHTNNYESFSDPSEFKTDKSCVIERYGIELDALGASYYFDDITEFIYGELGIDGVSEWGRKAQIPEEYEYEEVVSKIIDEVASDNEVYSKLKDLISETRTILSDLTDEQASVVEELTEILMDRKTELIAAINWDNRQREWDDSIEIHWYRCNEEICEHKWSDSDEWNTCPKCECYDITEVKGDWTPESIKEMLTEHWDIVKKAVENKSDFHDYWSGTLGFTKRQLTDKLTETINEEVENDEIDLPALDEDSEYLNKTVKLQDFDYKSLLEKIMTQFSDSDSEIELELEDDEWDTIDDMGIEFEEEED